MPWTNVAKDQLPPRAPEPVVEPQAAAPAIPLGPPGHVDNNRAWSRDGAQMTPELHKDTKPYLDAISRMGGDFKSAHADKCDEKREAKLLKRYNKDNPLAANATDEQKAAHAKGAQDMLRNFREQVPENVKVHNATRELRNQFKDYDESNYDAAAQDAFEQRYAELCQQAGRLEPSPLEQALPRNSPLRTKLDPLTGGLRDPSSGLYANMVEMGEGASKKNVLIFGGTGVGGSNAAQVQADAGQFMGGVPKAYQQAAALAGQVQNNLPPGERLETAGHSLGGGLANYAALKNGNIKATCFNAAALGGGCKASIGGNLDQAKDNVRHINVLGDVVGDGIGQARVPLQKVADDRNVAAIKEGAKALKQGAQWLARTAPEVAGQAAGAAAGFVAKKVDKQFGEGVERIKMNAGVIKDHAIDALPEPVRQAGEQVGAAAKVAGGVAAQGAKAVGGVAAAAAKPVQQAAKAVGKAAGQAAGLGVEVAGAVGLAAGVGALNAADLAGAAVTQVARPVRAAGKIVGTVATEAGKQVQNVGKLAQNVGGEVVSTASAVGKHAAGMLPQPVQEAGQQVASVASTAKKSVREILRDAKNEIGGRLNTIKEDVRDTAQRAGDAFAKTGAGKVAASGRDMAVKLHENLGLNQGKLAIPHQYGGCVTLENGGKNNPIGNHLTGALAKAFDRNARQNQAVRNQVSIGQRGGGGGGHGHGV
jgi:hypothetical protein